MPFGLSEKNYELIRDTFRLFPKVEEVVLFGSRAMGTDKPGSDIDLALKGKDITFDDILKISGTLEELPLAYKFDVLNYDSISTPAVARHIDRHGVKFYEKEKAPNKWKTYRLGDICSKIGSGATPRGGKDAYLDHSEIALIRSQNVTDFNFSYEGLAFISDDQAKELENVSVAKKDVLLNITGDSVARVCQVPDNILPARVNQHVAIIRPVTEKLNPTFLKYYLLNPTFKGYMLGLASTGGTRNALTKKMIEDFELSVPDTEIQNRVATTLSSFDDKIELNLRMNRTLEAMAQAIFKEWFVKFNFPGFDGKLVDGLPKGWRRSGIGNIIKVQNGYAFKSGDFKSEGKNGVIKIKNISNELVDVEDMQFIEEKIANEIDSRFEINEKDLLIAMTGAEVGKVGFVPYSKNKLWLNQRVGMIKEKVIHAKWFCYLILSSDEYQSLILSTASGSAQPNISSSQIENLEATIPSEDTIIKFGELVDPLFSKIMINYHENQTLTQLRDNLLPKLITGKIEVPA